MKHGIYVLSASGKEMEHIRAARTEAMRGKPRQYRILHPVRRQEKCAEKNGGLYHGEYPAGGDQSLCPCFVSLLSADFCRRHDLRRVASSGGDLAIWAVPAGGLSVAARSSDTGHPALPAVPLRAAQRGVCEGQSSKARDLHYKHACESCFSNLYSILSHHCHAEHHADLQHLPCSGVLFAKDKGLCDCPSEQC